MEGSPAAKRPLEASSAADRPETSGASPSPSPTAVAKRRHTSFSSSASSTPTFRSPPPSLKPSLTEALFRILCPAERTGGLIGKGGSIVRQLREETGAKIRIEDPIPGSEDRVIVVVADAQTKKRPEVSVGEVAAVEEISLAQHALFRVFERILKVEEEKLEEGEGGGRSEGEEKEVQGTVVCKLLALSNQVGCILGKGGKIIEKIRVESGAQVRVFGKDQVPACAIAGDVLIYISGSFSSVTKALLSVTSCLQENPRTETNNFPILKPLGTTAGSSGTITQMDPYAQSSYLPSIHAHEYHSRGHLINPGTELNPSAHRKILEEEVLFRMLCSNDKVGSLIGKAGVIIKTLQSETGAAIRIVEPVSDSDERIIIISARESSDLKHSPAQDAVIRVHSRLTETGSDKGSTVNARLLVPMHQIGCLLGKGGAIVAEMRKATGATIRIFVKEQIPKCAQPNDEVVQVTGTVQSVQDALLHITGRIRETIFPLKPYPCVGTEHFTFAMCDKRPAMLRSGHEPPGRYTTMSAVDPSIGLSGTPGWQPPLLHSVDHLGTDRAPFPFGSEVVGPRPVFDHPPPRPWTPEVMSGGNLINHKNVGTSTDYRVGTFGCKPGLVSKTIEVVVPQHYLGFVYGDNGSNLSDIREVSGASVTIHNPKPGETTGVVLISGVLDQLKTAQSLLHAFILSGMVQN